MIAAEMVKIDQAQKNAETQDETSAHENRNMQSWKLSEK